MVATPAKDKLRYRVDPDTECWVWLGSLSRQGYGQVGDGPTKRTLRAHRVSYELAKGPIPEGLGLDHLCRNRACINPDHLEPVTARENNHRSPLLAGKTICVRGHPLTEDNVYRGPVDRYRECRTCNRDRKAAWRARAKAQVGLTIRCRKAMHAVGGSDSRTRCPGVRREVHDGRYSEYPCECWCHSSESGPRDNLFGAPIP